MMIERGRREDSLLSNGSLNSEFSSHDRFVQGYYWFIGVYMGTYMALWMAYRYMGQSVIR